MPLRYAGERDARRNESHALYCAWKSSGLPERASRPPARDAALLKSETMSSALPTRAMRGAPGALR
ncbi:MAG: hypothetical protein R3B99_11610 [Polyangiales bacterium]